MPTYRKPDPGDGADAILADLLANWPRVDHLRTAGVTVSLLFAHAARDRHGEPKGVALTHHGYPALGVAKIVGQKDRADGMADARVVLDGDAWPKLPGEKRRALIAHELLHFEVVMEEARGEDGEGARVALDDCHRPKLKSRPHQWECGGFNEVVEDFGVDAVEIDALGDCCKQAGAFVQLPVDWCKAEAAGV